MLLKNLPMQFAKCGCVGRFFSFIEGFSMWYERTQLNWSIEALRALNSVYWGLETQWYDQPRNSRVFSLDIKDVIDMAKKKEGTPNGASATTRFSGTVTWNNVSLTDDDIEAIDNWQIDTGDLLGEVAILVENGYDLSSKFEDRSQSLAVYLTSMRLGAIDCGYGISARAQSFIDCLKVLLYKYHDRCSRNLANGAQTSARRFS